MTASRSEMCVSAVSVLMTMGYPTSSTVRASSVRVQRRQRGTGTRVVLDHGPLARAIRASCAIPGVFQPVEFQVRLLVDGGTVDNLPVAVAREKGADIVIAVDISQNVTNFNITNLVDVTLQAVHIMFSENVSQQRRVADVLISPAVGSVAMMDFTQKKRLMQAGMEAGQQAALAIRAAIEAWNVKNGRLSAVR